MNANAGIERAILNARTEEDSLAIATAYGRLKEALHVLEVLRDADKDRALDAEWPTFPEHIRALIDRVLRT